MTVKNSFWSISISLLNVVFWKACLWKQNPNKYILTLYFCFCLYTSLRIQYKSIFEIWTGEDHWDNEKKEKLKISKARLRNDFVPGHSYVILHVHETMSGERLVHLRNPWSRLKWDGDWSRPSSKWTALTRNEMKQYLPNIHEDQEPADGKRAN